MPDQAHEADSGSPAPEARPCLVVIIGASAGGLEAIQGLLGAIPPGLPLSFVVVQHLDPVRGSELVDILARSTALEVSAIEDGVVPQPGHVYVMPADADTIVEEGRLRLVPRESRAGMHLPINRVMLSLAADLAEQSAGVVLSGTGSDGTSGLEAIRSVGGITFAQEPGSATYDGMPRAAIQAGVVDIVATADVIAAELARLCRAPRDHVVPATEPAAEKALTEHPAFERILDQLRVHAGVDFRPYKDATIGRRIARRMLLRQVDDLDSYASLLEGDTAEVEALARDVLIMVTGFFREPEAFAALTEQVFPFVPTPDDPDSPVRVWVPGCGTGQEAYSLLIALAEYLGSVGLPRRIQMFATDVSEENLVRARQGLYSEGIVAELSEERLKRFFVPCEGGFRVSAALREQCVFARHDVTRDPPFSDLDLLSCRNLLIYFRSSLQHRVLSLFHYALRPDGFLLLGGAEGVGANPTLFETVDKRNRVFRRANVPSRPALATYVNAAGAPPSGVSAPVGRRASDAGFREIIDSVLLEHYGAAGVLVDENMDIVQIRGRTGPYLEPRAGDASLNLFDMAREGLSAELHGAMLECKGSGAAVVRRDVRIDARGGTRVADLEVVPLHEGDHGRTFFVLFSQRPELEPVPVAESGDETVDTPLQREISYLRRELETTRRVMQSLVDEKDAANEELRTAIEASQSANEELQSISEELETAKEELQSTNEELTTVNDELQSRNADLATVNDDLNNLLYSLQIPTLMLDADLVIRRYTPGSGKVLNVIPGDVGRPLSDIALRLEGAEVEATVRDVIRTGEPFEREVADLDGTWLSMVVRPYIRGMGSDAHSGSETSGVVLLFLDIDTIKRSELILEEANRLGEVLAAIDVAIGSPLPADQIIEKMTDRGAAALRADSTVVLEREDGAWRVRRASGVDDSRTHATYSDADVPLAVLTSSSGRPAVVSTAEQPHRVGDSLPDVFAGGSALAVPFTVYGKSAGAIYFGYKDGDVRFTDAEVDFGRKLAISVALALETSESRAKLTLAVEERTAELRAAVRGLEEASQVKDSFLADVSHELRTPLNAIIGFSGILKDGAAGELPVEAHKQAGMIHDSGMQLLGNLLDSAQLRAGRVSASIAPCDVAQLLDSVEGAMRPVAETAGLSLVVTPPSEPVAMLSDPGLIREVLFNLLENAVKYTGSGSVTLSAAQEGESVRFEVTDTGRGIAREDLPVVMLPFHQLAVAGGAKARGVGLGLSIASRFAQLLGGRIEAVSKVGVGSTFALVVPVRAPGAPTE
jgi:two-component system CheB/CheR fusion protein